MDKSPNPHSLSSQIYHQMREKETEELLAIWHKQDHQEWRAEAFEAVEAILQERLGEIPDPPEVEEQSEAEINADDARLLWLADLSNNLAGMILAASIVVSVIQVFEYLLTPSILAGFDFRQIDIVFGAVERSLYGLVAYVILKAIYEIIYLLLDIRSRLDTAGEAGE